MLASKMRLKLTYKIVTWLTIALFTPLAVLSFSGQVLCVGEDNHMQLESSGDSCCGLDIARLDPTDSIDHGSGQPGCGDCGDLDLGHIGSIRRLSRSVKAPETTVVVDLVRSVATTPCTNCPSNLTLRDKHLLAMKQSRFSFLTSILVC